ncbi:MAG: hypothetical protein IT386_10015 [Deltaproteobacteria bacterium]|nr:hypothetical protein [Deltaproteobacteria bacterium]
MTLAARVAAQVQAACLVLALLVAAAPARADGVCGNGVFETGEACDDGNTSGADCCSATCELQACSAPPQPLVSWEALGPLDVGGRVTALAVDPADPDRLLVGTPAAGVWRSEDRGASWVAIASWLDVAPVSALAIDPGESDHYVVATGGLQDSGAVSDAVGSVRTSDAGASWGFQNDASRTAYVGSALIWPGEPSRVLLATDRGLVLSTDGGATLAEVKTGDSFTTVLKDPFSSTNAYASGRLGLYRSLDRGATWTFVSAWPGVDTVENPGVATAVLAISQQTQGLLRAAVQDLATFSNTDRIILLESTDFGATWNELSVPASLCPESDLCGFANALAIDPGDDDRMLLGGDRLFRSLDGGASWTPLASTIRGVHEIALDFTGAVVAGRSGVAVLDATWQTVTLRNTGLPITQIVSLDAKRDASGALLAGTADSGTILGAGNPLAWSVVFGANQAASEARFDPFDPDVLYAGLRRGDYSRSDDGGASWTTITNGLSPTQTAADVAPLAPNPLIEGELFTGRLQLFRTTNRGDLWTEHRPPGAPEVAVIAPSPVIDDRLYFALTKGGTLFKTDGINTDTFVLDSALDARITAIHPDPGAENRVYVATTNTATLTGAIWRTENFGATWEDRSFGKLPAVSDVVRDANGALYAATSKGVYRSASEGLVWSPFNEGLPTKAISRLVVDGGSLVAGTRGRGLFEVPASPLVAIDTIPPGQRIVVDGVLREGPFYADWAAGTEHVIAPYLLQTEDTRQEFVGWTQGGAQQQTFVPNGSNEWPTAVVEVTHRLRTQVSPSAGGSLVAEPASADGFYPFQSFVQLIAIPADDHRLAGWSGQVVSASGLLAGAAMDGPRSVTAIFDPLLIAFRTDPAGLTIGIDGQSITTPQTFQWARGSLHPLDPPATVDLDPGDPLELVFDRWSDYLPRTHDFEMRSETFTADVTARYLQVVKRASTPAGGVQRLTTQGTQQGRRERALSLEPAAGERLPATLQFLRSSAEGVSHELALPRGKAVTRVDAFVEGRTLEGKGGLTGDGRTRRTRLVFFNPGTQEASISLTLSSASGTPTAGGADLVRVGAGSQQTVMLDEVLGLPRSYEGVLGIQSTQAIQVCVLGVTENLRGFDFTDPILFHLFDESDTGVPVNGTTQVLLATPDTEHVIVLINPDPTTSSGTVFLRDRDGAALEGEVDGALSTSTPFLLPGGAHRVLRVRFPSGVPGSDGVPQARAEILTTSGPALRIRALEERAIGTTRYGTSTLPRSLPASSSVTAFLLPVDLGRRDTGVVLTNRGILDVQVTIDLQDRQGVTAGTWVVEVPAGAQRVQRVSELVPAPPAGFFGQLRASAAAQIDAVGFTRTVNGRAEEIVAGLPVLTSPEEAPGAAHRFPFAVDGDTFASEWWLLSTESGARQATLHFVDGAGAERFLPMQAPETP